MPSISKDQYKWTTEEESRYLPFLQVPMPSPNLTQAKFSISSGRSFEDFSLIQVTDIHYRPSIFGRQKNWLEKLLEQIDALKVDFLIFTGDAYCKNQYKEAKRVADAFKSLCPRIAKIAIPGNGDLYRLSHFEKSFEKAGFEVLIDSSLEFKEKGINFVGSNYHIDYPLEALLELRNKKLLNLFLCHSPDIAWTLPKNSFDLTLCGHTHGGQIRMPRGRAIATNLDFPDKHDLASGGFRIINGNPFYVNRGIGFSYLPFRLFCPAELLYLEIKSDEIDGKTENLD